MELSLPSLAARIPTEDAAYRLLEELRWGDQPVCPHCGSVRKPYFLNPKNGGRKTTRGKFSPRRVFKCADCRKQFSATTGTIFHGSHIPIRSWLFVVFEMCSSKNGVSSREIERKYDLTPKSAWFMTHRIREAMKRGDPAALFVGTVEADETYIGGDPKNRHGKGPRSQGRMTDKTPVVSLVHPESGEVRSRVVSNVTGALLHEVIEGNVDMPNSTLHTDSSRAYRMVAPEFPAHEAVDHSKGEYVRGLVTTNHVEGFFSQLCRSLDGTHHHVSVEHLDRYLAEFDYRFSTRRLSDSQRMARLMGQTAGRRLTYRRPRGLE